MVRIFEPEITKEDNALLMKELIAEDLNATYDFMKIGYEVNDGKFVKYINDKVGGTNEN